jgi:hypothetical protein
VMGQLQMMCRGRGRTGTSGDFLASRVACPEPVPRRNRRDWHGVAAVDCVPVRASGWIGVVV